MLQSDFNFPYFPADVPAVTTIADVPVTTPTPVVATPIPDVPVTTPDVPVTTPTPVVATPIPDVSDVSTPTAVETDSIVGDIASGVGGNRSDGFNNASNSSNGTASLINESDSGGRGLKDTLTLIGPAAASFCFDGVRGAAAYINGVVCLFVCSDAVLHAETEFVISFMVKNPALSQPSSVNLVSAGTASAQADVALFDIPAADLANQGLTVNPEPKP